MVARTIDVVFTEKGASRVTRAMTDIERTAKKSANDTAAAYNKSTKRISDSFSKATSGGLKNFTSGLALMGGPTAFAASAGLASVAVGLKSVVTAARDQERANRLTNAVLASTGGVAGVTADHVSDLASQLSLVSGVNDEVIQSGQNVLLTFTAVRNEVGKGNDVFDQATTAALDMSAALGSDLQSNIIRVGKALQDPIGGITALRRVGVNVDELKGKVEKLVESGDKLGAQRAILKELQVEFGGAAAAAADPFTKLNVAVDELKESLGRGVIPVLTTYVDLLGQAARLAGQLPGGGGTGGGRGLDELNSLKGFLGGVTKVLLTGPAGIILEKRAFDQAKKNADEFKAAKKAFDDIFTGFQAGTATQAQVTEANVRVQKAYRALHPELDKGSKALKENANSADRAKFAYLGLGEEIKTAAQAIDAIISAASTPLRANIDVRSARSDVDAALAELTNPGGTEVSAGSSGQTATAAALERADKEATLRDAIQGVADADQEAADAQRELVNARKDYNTVINGVAANTLKAKEAQDAYTAASINAKSAAIGLRDANRELSDALYAQSIAAREAREAVGAASRGVAGSRLDVQDARLNLQDAIEGEDPTEIARARLALADATARQRDAEEALVEARRQQKAESKKNSEEDDRVKRAKLGVKDATLTVTQANKDETEALRILNGTLHGFPPASREAQEAQQRLTDATRNAREAQDTQADSARQLQRAQADLAGKLDSVASGFSKAEKKAGTFQERLDKVALTILDLANKTKVADQAAGRSTEAILKGQVDLFQGYVNAYPALAGALGPIIEDLNFKLDRQRYKNDSFGRGNTYNRGRSSSGPATRAVGGEIRKGQPYLVGERGPEMVVPRNDSTVVPNSSLWNSRPARGGDFHWHQNAPVYGVEDLRGEIAKALREYERRGHAPV